MIAHRPWDYHPDHRYVGVLVQDAAFMVTVPFFCPDVSTAEEEPGIFFIPATVFRNHIPLRRISLLHWMMFWN